MSLFGVNLLKDWILKCKACIKLRRFKKMKADKEERKAHLKLLGEQTKLFPNLVNVNKMSLDHKNEERDDTKSNEE